MHACQPPVEVPAGQLLHQQQGLRLAERSTAGPIEQRVLELEQAGRVTIYQSRRKRVVKLIDESTE